ncbi:MAG: hypothetical protein IMZ64_07460 [Bacteroidetes bacterium]|nr:hypothetical protein [Bacteroidota bacterium]
MNKLKNNIVFLDLDGVLNTPQYAVQAFSMWKRTDGWFKSRDKYGQVFDPLACACLEYLVHSTGAKVVISSTWRMSGLEVMQQMFKDREIAVDVIGITPTEVDVVERGTLEYYDLVDRGHEIQQWVNDNEVSNYVILDDHNDFTPEQLEFHYVDCSGKEGFNYNAMAKALKILLTRK